MNKLTKLLSVFVIAGAIGTGVAGAVGCHKDPEPEPGPGPSHTTHNYKYTDNGNGTHDGTCDGCELIVDDEAHTYGADKKCTKCEHETTPTELDADDYSATPVKVASFEDVTGTPAQVASPKVPEYAGAAAALTAGQVNAVFEFDPATLSTTKYADGWTNGTFSIAKGTEVRGRIKTGLYEEDTCVDATYVTKNSVKLAGSSDALEIDVPAAGTLVFYVQNGSSGATGTQTVYLSRPDEEEDEAINYAADGNASTIQRITVDLNAEGHYKIYRKGGTSDIYYAKFTTTLDESPVEGIEIANTGKTEFLVGQQLDCTSVAVVRRHKSKVTIPVSSENIEIDASEYNPAVAGTYAIKVKYTIEGNLDSETKVFETSYNVDVYDYGDLSVHVEHVKQGANSAAGNGCYVNNAFRQYYTVGETFSTDGITLSVEGKLGDKKKTFKIDSSVATITGADLSKAGVQTVKIAYTINGITKAKGVLITVKEKPASIQSETEVMVAVNKKFAQTNIGTKNSYGAYRFNTIQQALEFLEASSLDENTPKTMYLEEGTYWEKVEVNVPNLTIIGKGADKTKIEYDALYGVEDAGGFVHVTDSTATLNVRDKAVGFTIKGVTISNYYNTAESYNGAPSNDCRALAMLIQSDKTVVENCTLLGYQDTLELFTGRQYFKNCLIMGVTDYIFGTNNTTYFYKCELRNINHKNANQAGYVTAFKGNNKGTATDKVTYGAIFDDCDFTADEGVPAGACAMGRAWGVDAAVMIMNSRIGGHISKTDSTSAGGRYISMGNGDPAGAQFVEYNNTGDGAITESLATVTVLTEAQAKNYNDFTVIFGKTNNKVTYSTTWDGSYGSKVTEKNFNFDDIMGGSFNYEDFTDIYTGLSVKGSGNVEAHKSQAKFDVGTVIKVGVKGKVTVTWYGGDYGTEANGRIVYKDGYATINIIGSESDQIYITKITVDLETVPADTVERTVTIKEGENILETLTVNDGDKVTLKQIKALITGEAYEGKEIDVVYGSDGTTVFDFDTAISADTTIIVTVKDKQTVTQQTIATTTKYVYDKTADSIEDTEYFKFTNCDKNGDWFKYGHKAGSSIEFTVAAGAVITWTCSPYDSGSVSINGVDQHTSSDSLVMYVCTEGGKITITASGQCFFKELSVVFSTVHTVSFDLNYGEDEETPAMDSVTVLNEGKVKAPKTPTRSGYTFVHWYTGDDDSVAYDFNTAVTEPITLKAKWEVETDPYIRTSSEFVYSNPKSDGTNYDKADGVAEPNSGKFKFDGLVANNVWLRFSSDNANIELNVLEGSVITITVNGGETLTFAEGEAAATEVAANADKKVIYTAQSDCTLTIKRKSGTNAYLKTISVYVPPRVVTETGLSYTFTGDTESTAQVEIVNGINHENKNTYLCIKNGGYIQVRVKEGYKITVTSQYDAGAVFYEEGDAEGAGTQTKVGNDVTSEFVATKDGIIKIQEKTTQVYVMTITVTPP
ncbi:MAG: InlB B-repeat-containing protein, partial [Clostridia bacterium]|nr:InlB B-repeat-containing protein [Clostridia bacterium]